MLVRGADGGTSTWTSVPNLQVRSVERFLARLMSPEELYREHALGCAGCEQGSCELGRECMETIEGPRRKPEVIDDKTWLDAKTEVSRYSRGMDLYVETIRQRCTQEEIASALQAEGLKGLELAREEKQYEALLRQLPAEKVSKFRPALEDSVKDRKMAFYGHP